MQRRRRRRRYRFKKRFWVLLAILILFVVGGSVLFLRSCSKEEEGSPSAPETDKTVLAEAADAGEAYLDKVVFIGDSRTLGLATYQYVPESRVLAQQSLNHKDARKNRIVARGDKKMTIAAAVEEMKPEVMIVAFGINGMGKGGMTESEYMREYEGLIDDLVKASPQSKLAIQSIYPVGKAYDVENPSSGNDIIAKYNRKLLTLAQDKGLYFLDTAEALTDENGLLDESCAEPDGLHINTKGYETVLAYVRTHPVPGVQTGGTKTSSDDDASASDDDKSDDASDSEPDDSDSGDASDDDSSDSSGE